MERPFFSQITSVSLVSGFSGAPRPQRQITFKRTIQRKHTESRAAFPKRCNAEWTAVTAAGSMANTCTSLVIRFVSACGSVCTHSTDEGARENSRNPLIARASAYISSSCALLYWREQRHALHARGSKCWYLKQAFACRRADKSFVLIRF